jgi:hypothetical protein
MISSTNQPYTEAGFMRFGESHCAKWPNDKVRHRRPSTQEAKQTCPGACLERLFCILLPKERARLQFP